MGYVPPTLIVKFPGELSYPAFEAYRRLYVQHASHPQMVVRYPLPASLDEYRRSLYGRPGYDWMPVMRWGLLSSVAALVVAVLWRFLA